MKSRYLLSAGAALAVAFSCADANAQFAFLGGPYPVTFYVGPEGGWTSLSNHINKVSSTPFSVGAGAGPAGALTAVPGAISLPSTYNSGFNVGGRLGLQYGPFRVEEEYSFRHNGLSDFDGFTAGSGHLFSGSRNAHAIMTNFLYDFTLGWPVSPHLGFGVGAVDIVDSTTLNPVSIEALHGSTPAGPFSEPARVYGGTLLKGSSWQFGYQAIAGIRYDINPLLAFDLDYRYLATTEATFNNKGVFPAPPVAFGGTRYKSGYSTHNIVASLTMKFGAPPPPPPPPPPAPPPPPVHQVYLVFFDWDKFTITPEGMQIIQLAANQYHAGGAVRLQVTGYTDLSGPAGYNQRLSERRANAVATALERLGVPRTDMAVSGRGMNDPRVPTPRGVREPQNRRVEIVFP
ncbi:MAG: OmpA family protein [Alphaproteobacteria bacterium]|nr:OmpA family protein [Alphaproteobacteria bacterium]